MAGERRRGFTLIELLAVVMLVALMLGLALANFARGRSGASSAGLARVVAEELRLARHRAMATHSCTAVCFPSDQGTVPISQSLYLLQGEVRPGLQQVVRLERDFPGSFVFVGYWSVAGGSTLSQSRLADGSELADLRGWAGRPDPMILFTPSGSALSNGVPLFDGEFHLLVAQGIDYQAAPVPGGSPPLAGAFGGTSYSSPTRVCAPFTVTVSPLGAVRVESGVVGDTGSVASLPAPPAARAPATPPTLSAPPSSPPVVERVTASPAPGDAALLPPGSVAVCSDGGHVSLRLEAQDSDPDDPLYCVWSSDPPGTGRFSSASGNRMEWDPGAGVAGKGAWVATWEWSPPTSVPAMMSLESTYDLSYRVYDRQNQTPGPAQAGTLEVVRRPPDNLFFYYSDGPSADLLTCREDGTGLRYLTRTAEDEFGPLASPDQSRIAYLRAPDPAASISLQYLVCQLDGSGARALTPPLGLGRLGGGWNWMSWNPTSTCLVLQMPAPAGDWDLYVKDLEDYTRSPPVKLGCNSAADEVSPLWSPQGDRIAYQSSKGGQPALWALERASSADFCLTSSPPLPATLKPVKFPWMSFDAQWNAAGTRLAIAATPSGAPSGIFTLGGDGQANSPVQVTPLEGNREPAWSPDEARLAYVSGSGGIRVKASDGTGVEGVLSDVLGDCHPVWSRNGKCVFFVRDTSTEHGLYRVAADGTEPPLRLTSASNRKFFVYNNPGLVNLGPSLVRLR